MFSILSDIQRQTTRRGWKVFPDDDGQFNGFNRGSSILSLRCTGLLADRTSQPILCSTGDYFHQLSDSSCSLYLGRFGELLGQSLPCPVFSWSWYWVEIVYCSYICGGMFSSSHPGSFGNDVADVSIFTCYIITDDELTILRWTAFGIMLGNIIGVAFGGLEPDLAWRLMLGSTVVLPLLVCAQVYYCPESPRWLIQHNKVEKAFRSFRTLRPTELQAARDIYYAYVGVEMERKINRGKGFWHMLLELFTIPRNARATAASTIVMWLQQYCAVNIIAYYSTTIFLESGFGMSNALLASMGTGILNWVFALPAFLTIDTWGRRNLLLFTLPWLAIWLLFTGFSFYIEPENETSKTRLGMVTTGLYLFEVFYSPGQGPVPFTYSAEAFPLHVREVGMSWATAVTWCWNFIISFTWPHLRSAFKPQGAFGWYAAWCLIGWVLVLLFVPETKCKFCSTLLPLSISRANPFISTELALTLEELDQVFSVSTRKHASYQLKNTIWHLRVWVFRQKLDPLPNFYKEETKLEQ